MGGEARRLGAVDDAVVVGDVEGLHQSRLEVPAEVVAPEVPAPSSPPPALEPPPDLAPAPASEYRAYVEARRRIESVLDAEPERLRDPEVRAAYAALLAAEARVERAFEADLPPPIRRRLLSLRRFEATGAQVRALAARLSPAPKP